MKRLLLIMFLMSSAITVSAIPNFDFSMVISSGQTLFFKYVTDSTVYITYPVAGYNSRWAGYAKPSGSVDIPNTVIQNGIILRVTSIGIYAFDDCTEITSVTLPQGISVHYDAFHNCSGLHTVFYNGASIGYTQLNSHYYSLNSTNNNIQNIIVGTNVKTIPSHAFVNCGRLKTITIGDSVINVNSYAFEGSLDSVVCINYQAIACTTGNIFANCYRLTEIIIGDNVKSIPYGMFKNCHNLHSLTIGDSIRSIGYDAFENCNQLDTIFFNADSCLSMGYRSSSYPYTIYSPFEGCSGVTTLFVGENVRNIPTCAFYHCTNLSTVNLLSPDPPLCDINSFAYTSINNTVFNIPCHSQEAYETAWSNYNIYNFVEPTSPNFTVDFSPEQTTNVILRDSLMGFATYNTYGLRCDSSAVVVGAPYYGYKFIAWQDGNTENPRMVHLSSDTTFTALFAKRMFHVYPESSDTTLGTVSNPDSALYRDTLTITAYPKHGYELSYWTYADRNGNNVYCYDNPARIPIEQTILIEAHFAPMALNVQFLTEGNCGHIQEDYYRLQGNYGYGPVYGWGTHTGNYHYLDSVRLTINPHHGYRFKQWSDGNRDNPRYIKLFQDTMLTALFDRDSVWLTVVSADTTLGIVTGSGWYAIYDTATLVAIPAEHYHLTEWIVDVPYSYANYDPHNNPLCLYVENAGTVTALFAIDTHTVSVVSNDILHGNVEGGGEFEYGAPCTITATAYSGYRFVRWSNGVTYNPYTFAVTTDMELTAIFVEEGSIYNIIATVADPTMGTVTGAGPYGVGEEAVLTAIPNTGYQFDHWQDNNTQNPRTITVTGNATYTAYFVSTQGINNVIVDVANVYTLGGQIVVETELNDEIGIYDIVGRKVDGGHKTRFDVPVSGMYLVKIGTSPTQKVVVVK